MDHRAIHPYFNYKYDDILEPVTINQYVDQYIFGYVKHYIVFGFICKICECNPNRVNFDSDVILCISSGKSAGKICRYDDITESETYVSFKTRDESRLHQEYLSIMIEYFLARDIKLKFRKCHKSALHDITHILFPIPNYSTQLKFVETFRKFLIP